MSFNARSFAEGALTELSKQIDINTEEAKTYEEEQRELAKVSRRTISQRRGVVSTLVGVAKKLEKLGATKAQIQAAHSSGPGGLMALNKAIMTAMEERGGRERFISEYDIDTLITASDMGSEFEQMDYQEFIDRSMGLDSSAFGPSEVDPNQNFLQRALGFGDKAAARARLDRELVDGNMSILDINEAAAQAAYQSAMPGSYATFSPGEMYDSEDALTGWISAETVINRNLLKNEEYLKLRTTDEGAALRLQRNKFGAYAATQFEKYGVKAYENSVIDWGTEAVLGPELYTKLGLQFGFIDSVESTLDPIISDGASTTVTLSDGSKLTTGPNGRVISILLPTSTEPLTNTQTIENMLKGFRERNIILPNNTTGVLNTGPSPQSLGSTDLDAGPVGGIPTELPPAELPPTGDLVTVFDNMDEAAMARSNLPVGTIVTIAGKKHTVTQAPPREGAIEGMSSTKYFIEVPEAIVPKPKAIVPKSEEPVTAKKRTLADDVGVVYDTFDKVTSYLSDFFSGGDDEGSYVINIPALGDDYFKVNAETLALIRNKAPEILLNDNVFVEEFGTQEIDDEDINEYALKTYMPGNNREIIKKLKKLGYEVD